MTRSPRTGPIAAGRDTASLPRVLVCGATHRFTGADDLACRFSSDVDAPFDGLIFTDAPSAAAAPMLLRRRRAWLAPVADLSGGGAWFAVRCADASQPSLRRAVEELLRVIDALASLPAGVTAAGDDETLLLARTHSRGGRLRPVYDGTAPSLLRYPAAGLLEEPAATADRLREAGWFERTFFDRLHVCPRCTSSRLNVREECSACRSPRLSQETFVHHFRCAFQATERHFGHGDKLICPKCRRRLRHFGVDYDRPGGASVCGACGHVDADPAIGFVCIDCGVHSDASQVGIRDWHAYTLTAAGEQRLLGGDLRRLQPGAASDGETLHALAEHWLRIQSRYDRPSVVLRLTFRRAAEVAAEQGGRVVAAARRQAIEIVRGELRETDLMIDTPDGLLMILPETEVQSVDAPLRRLQQRLSSLLAIDLGIDIGPVEPGRMSLERSAAAP